MTDKRDNDQLRVLLSHVDELCDRAKGGLPCHTDFLSPRELRHATELLRRRGACKHARAHGGYADAERTCLLFFPDYVIDAYDGCDLDEISTAELLAMAGEDDPVSALFIRGSGYRTLTHRDYLGSLLSLGLERDVLGDIAVNEQGATLLCLSRMVPFLLSSVERIGGDAVRVERIELPPDFDGGRRFTSIADTVASPRLDCIVAALADLSREAAQAAVRDGLVELDYECETRSDHTVEAPCTLSIRGKGKFILRELGTLTRKGRIRLLADKYM